MIYTHIAYAPTECDKNIGCAYNKFMDILPNDDDWACFLDHDAMFTTTDWYTQLNRIISAHPNVGAFGVRTNRVAYPWQLVGNIDVDNMDIRYHRNIGEYLQKKYFLRISRGSTKNHTGEYEASRFSGVVILIQKKIWKRIGGFEATGFLGIDDDLRFRVYKENIPFAIMDGVYVYHWYRYNTSHSAENETLNIIRRKYKQFLKKNVFSFDKIKLFDENFTN
jgi:hypothetical protein